MRWGLSLIAPLCLLVVAGCASSPEFGLQQVASPYGYQYTWEQGRIYHAPTGREMTESELYGYLAGYNVIYVGESHDSVNDHEVQIKILKALAERYPGEVALGLEMLRTDAQGEADRWVAGAMTEKEMMRVWADNWGFPSYPYYRDILNYVREQRISLVALNRPRQPVSPPADPATGAELLSQPPTQAPAEPEIDGNDPYYDAYIGAFLAGHDAGPDTREMFMRGQLLWDETMAESGAAFLSKPGNRSKKLLVFAGGNHVRYGFGIPRRLFRRVPVNYAIVSPQVVDYPQHSIHKLMDIEPPELPLPPADIIWLVGYEDLEDQRVALGMSIAPAAGGGVLVKEIYPGSPADRAGLVPGDVIRRLDDTEVAEMFDLSYELSAKLPGDNGVITIERATRLLELNIDFENYTRP